MLGSVEDGDSEIERKGSDASASIFEISDDQIVSFNSPNKKSKKS